MSSPERDARWHIAIGVAEASGVTWEDLPFSDKELLLAAAEDMLLVLGTNASVELARQFNDGKAIHGSKRLKKALDNLAGAKARIKQLEKQNSDLSWSVNPDRMGL